MIQQIQTPKNINKLRVKPILSIFLITERDPSIKPNQTNANNTLKILTMDVFCFLKTSLIIDSNVINTNIS